MKTSSQYRADARKALYGKWGQAVVATLVFMVLVMLSSGSGSLTETFSGVEVWSKVKLAVAATSFSLLSAFLVVMPLAVGMEATFLEVKRNSKENITRRMFSIGYSNLGKSVVYVSLITVFVIGITFAYLLVFVLVMSALGFDFSQTDRDIPNPILFMFMVISIAYLWAMLYVAYLYSMTPFIILDNPELSGVECMKKSRLMMKGNCWRLFCLDISFIGWFMLCFLIFPILFVGPYQQTARAVFYGDLIGEKSVDEYLMEEQKQHEQIIKEAQEKARVEAEKSILDNDSQPVSDGNAQDADEDVSAEDFSEV